MKVLQINTTCGRGSTGRIATDLLTCLKAAGHTGKIAYGVGPALHAAPEEQLQVGNRVSYWTHNVLSRLTDGEGRFSAWATRSLLRQIEAERPDVIHLHNLHGHYLNVPLLFSALKEWKIPVVWTLHDCWAFTGHCAHFSALGCEQWKTGCYHCGGLRSYPSCVTGGRAAANFAGKRRCFTGVDRLVLVTPSRWLADLTRDSFLREYPVQVIPNGIDLSRFRGKTGADFRRKHHLEDKRLLLGVAGVWTERKGYSDFVRLAEHLPEDQRLVLVGVHEKQARSLPGSVIAVEKTDSLETLAEIYAAADVFLNFTYEDNFPTVNLEAMACGTPVITYRTGGSVEPVTEKTGFIVEQGDYPGAHRLLDRARELDRNEIRKAARAYRAEDRYAEYLALYKSLTSQAEEKGVWKRDCDF